MPAAQKPEAGKPSGAEVACAEICDRSFLLLDLRGMQQACRDEALAAIVDDELDRGDCEACRPDAIRLGMFWR